MGQFDKKIKMLEESIRSTESLLVSYSGGVDSTALAVVAKEVLQENMACAVVDSPLIPRSEIATALEIAESFSIPCYVLNSDIMGITEFIQNKKDRCYLCKKEMSRLLTEEAGKRGFEKIADGSNVSDTSKYRPGFKASEEAGVIHPFIEAGMDKEDVRRLARLYELSVSEKPSASCLASRIPYDESLDPVVLGQIERSEEFIRSLGAGQVRVRKHGDIARIEVDPRDFDLVISKRDEILRFLKKNGFRYINLDLDGFVSGSMD